MRAGVAMDHEEVCTCPCLWVGAHSCGGGKGGEWGPMHKIGVVWHSSANMGTPQGLWGPMFAQGPTFGALVLVLVLDKCGRWAAALAFTSL